MPVIQVEAQVSAEQLLKAVEQMPEQEFVTFVTQVLLLRAQREAPRLSLSESELLLKINQGIPDELHNRFNQLIAKREALKITDAELEELIQLTDRIEQLDAERIEFLAELARLRSAIAHRSHARFTHSTSCLCLVSELLPSNAG